MTDNKFYTCKPVMKCVTKDEFKDFISKYPRKLEITNGGICCDPPLILYNDYEISNTLPYSVVAHTCGCLYIPLGMVYPPEDERKYYIMENYEDVFNSRNGYKEVEPVIENKNYIKWKRDLYGIMRTVRNF